MTHGYPEVSSATGFRGTPSPAPRGSPGPLAAENGVPVRTLSRILRRHHRLVHETLNKDTPLSAASPDRPTVTNLMAENT
ncbi:hypothetical protein GCM10027418_19690 [Mariniluteicoccus endophyticus]